MNRSTCSSPSLLPLLLILSTGCATVADTSASLLGPNAVEKVQRRRQAKEVDAVAQGRDIERAAQMCSSGVDKDGLQLKKDLHDNVCKSYGAMLDEKQAAELADIQQANDAERAAQMCSTGVDGDGLKLNASLHTQSCGAYASMMVTSIEAMSCEEFVTVKPSLLRYNETNALNMASDARANACKKQFEEAKAAADAQARAEVLAKLKSESSREDLGKICRNESDAKALGLKRDDQKIVCTEYTTLTLQEFEKIDCSALSEEPLRLYREVENNARGSSSLSKMRDLWLDKAISCDSWENIFTQLIKVEGSATNRNRSAALLKRVQERDASFVKTLYDKMGKGDFLVKKLDDSGRFNFASAVSSVAIEDTTVGDCKTFAKVLDLLDTKQGKHHILNLMTARECSGHRKAAEALLVSDAVSEREYACHYLAKFGDKGSVKKMRTLSYTDSYTYKYTYPVREACRDAYGKLELKLTQ